jgi:hypothetical protein
VVWHVDGAEIHRNSEHYIWSSQSFMAPATNVWDTKYVFCTIPHRLMRTERTKKHVLVELAKLVAWEHQVLLSGEMPHTGWRGEDLRDRRAGQPIAGGMLACFAGIKHDGKARKELHMMHRSYMSSFLCDSCLACQANPLAPRELYFGDFTPSAAYRSTQIRHEAYVRTSTRVSPWLAVGGWRLELTYHDILHVLFLGVLRDTCACALVEMCAGGSMAEQLASLTEDGTCLHGVCIHRACHTARGAYRNMGA